MEVYGNPLCRPQPFNYDFLAFYGGLILDQEKQCDGNADDTETYHQKQVLCTVAVALINVCRKTKRGHDEPDADADVIASDVLFFQISVTVSHFIQFDNKVTGFLTVC